MDQRRRGERSRAPANRVRSWQTRARARRPARCVGFVVIYVAIRRVCRSSGSRRIRQYEAHRALAQVVGAARPDIVDRNGEMLATDVQVPSSSRSRASSIDVDEATELLTAVMPDLDAGDLREKLASKKGFVWLKREITPEQQARSTSSACRASAS